MTELLGLLTSAGWQRACLGVSRAGQAWNHVDIASKAMAALFRLRPNRVLCAGGVCATKHLKETKAFDHFWPSKVMPCRGERRKG
ncbi:hypothetical protein [Sphingobacterium griseoflavum]|uniref:hypothetical protein n=1 Tax=Sphingobacterium griseoflavum TaxID=1474952 RepID=UPI003644EC32